MADKNCTQKEDCGKSHCSVLHGNSGLQQAACVLSQSNMKSNCAQKQQWHHKIRINDNEHK